LFQENEEFVFIGANKKQNICESRSLSLFSSILCFPSFFPSFFPSSFFPYLFCPHVYPYLPPPLFPLFLVLLCLLLRFRYRFSMSYLKRPLVTSSLYRRLIHMRDCAMIYILVLVNISSNSDINLLFFQGFA